MTSQSSENPSSGISTFLGNVAKSSNVPFDKRNIRKKKWKKLLRFWKILTKSEISPTPKPRVKKKENWVKRSVKTWLAIDHEIVFIFSCVAVQNGQDFKQIKDK